MRVGARRGLAKAKALSPVEIRQFQERDDSKESSEKSREDSADSVASSTSSTSPVESTFSSTTKKETSPTSTSFPAVSKTESSSPTSTTFPPGLTSSAKATSTTSTSADIKTLTHASPAVTNSAVIVSTSTSLGLLPQSQVASSDAAESTTLLQNNSNGLGQTRPSDLDPVPQPGGLDKGQIALVTLASLGFVALIIFFLWKWRRHQKGANQEHVSRLYGSDTSSDRMSVAYANDNGRNSYQDRGPMNSNGYMDEKYAGFGDQQPILRPEPTANPKGTMDPTFDNSISDWMNYQTQQEMVNPMTARNSVASSAVWNNIPPFTPGLMGENGTSAVQSADMPPPLDPRFAAANIQAPQTSQFQNGGKPISIYAGQKVSYLERPPIPPEPHQPPAFRLPPPPGRMSVALTEVTNNTESTWNTWGVIQHKKQPKNSWKARFGA